MYEYVQYMNEQILSVGVGRNTIILFLTTFVYKSLIFKKYLRNLKDSKEKPFVLLLLPYKNNGRMKTRKKDVFFHSL